MSVLKVLPSPRRPPASLSHRLEPSAAVHSGSPGLISLEWQVIQWQRRKTMQSERPLAVGGLNLDMASLMSVSLAVMEQQEQEERQQEQQAGALQLRWQQAQLEHLPFQPVHWNHHPLQLYCF